MLKQLWNDDAGFIVSTELLLIFTILVLGLVAGLTNLRNAVVIELSESASAILALNQGYSISGLTGCGSSTSGSGFTDSAGFVSLGTLAPVVSSSAFNLCP